MFCGNGAIAHARGFPRLPWQHEGQRNISHPASQAASAVAPQAEHSSLVAMAKTSRQAITLGNEHGATEAHHLRTDF